MKNKYERMTKEEKKNCKIRYYTTPKGKEMKIRFQRLNFIGIVGIFFSVFLVVSGSISKEINWATWAMATILFLFSCVYIIGSYILKKKCLNNFAIKEKNNFK